MPWVTTRSPVFGDGTHGALRAPRWVYREVAHPIRMNPHVEAPTPQALADLVRRCAQINRYTVQLTEAEEGRVAALASAILVMRGVLELEEIPAQKLPPRQGRIRHWALTGEQLADVMTPAIKHVHGRLVLDEHEQVKILSHRTWRGVWRVVTLWRDGVHGCSAADLMEYLARLAGEAQHRTPGVARSLLARSEAIVAAHDVSPSGPRMRAD